MSTESDPCPHCGRDDFGNAGARTQHVRACREEAEKFQQAEQQEPQVVPVEQNQQNGGRPAVDQAGEGMATGLAAAFDSDAPLEQRTEAVGQATNLLGGVVKGIMKYKTEKQNRMEQHAQQADVEQTDDKPQCECGAVFAEIPMPADRIQCGNCGREYRVTG